MKTSDIEYAIQFRYDIRTHLVIPNAYWGAGFSYEIDVLVVRKTGYCLEFEIKQSFADFKNDFKKYKWQTHRINGTMKLNDFIKEFYYVFPAELWFKREGDIIKLLPEFAGVIIVFNQGENKIPRTELKRKAKQNTSAKPMNDKQMHNVARLGMIRYWSLARKIISK